MAELRLFTQKVSIVVLFGIALALVWAARHVLMLVLIAAAIAAGIAPAVYRVRVVGRHLLRRNIPRGAAVLIVYLPFVVLVLLLAIFVVPQLIEETRTLSAQLPQLIENNILKPLEHYASMTRVRQYIRQNGVGVPSAQFFGALRVTFTAIAEFFAVLFMVAYMLIDANRLRNMILLFSPPHRRTASRRVLTRMARRMSSWLSAQFVLSGIIGIATFVGLLCLRVPFALPLAIFATIGAMVPVVGPIIGTAPALVVAILQSRWQFWSVLILAVVLAKIENLFVAPRVMSRRVRMSPLTAFVAFMVGGAVFGIIGALMAIPAAAVLQVIFDEVFVEQRERRMDRDRAGTLRFRRE
jgi:predicted PurR-regulated permease PerM